ncbi:MAG: hypothetical protein Kow00107_00730 [Planctomycetota bacterium]
MPLAKPQKTKRDKLKELLLRDPPTEDFEELSALTEELLTSEDWRDRLAAVNAVGHLRITKLRFYLVEMLGDRRGCIRQACAEAIDKLDYSNLLQAVDGTRNDFTAMTEAVGEVCTPALGIALETGDPRTRLAALRSLEALGEFDQILNGLDDPSWRVRCEAISILSRSGRSELANFVILSMEDPDPRVRREAAFAIANLGDASTKGKLLLHVADEDPRVRIAVAACLEEHVQSGWRSILNGSLRDAERLAEVLTPEVKQAVKNALSKPPSHWTKALADATGLTTTEPAEPPVKKKAPPRPPLTRKELEPSPAKAPSQPKPKEEPVVNRVAEEPTRAPENRVHADQDTPDSLVKALGSGDPGVQIKALKKLAELRHVQAYDQIVALLSHTNADVRRAATMTLSTFGEKRAILPILELMTDMDKSVRTAAQGALENLGAYRMFFSALSDKHPEVRRAAILNLGKLKDQRALPILKDLLVSEEEIRSAAATALASLGYGKWDVWIDGNRDDFFRMAKSGDPEATEVLIKALSSPVSEIRKQAADVVGLTKSPAAVEKLIEMLRDKYEFAAVAAANSLGQLGDQRAIGPLMDAMKDLNWVKRVAAAIALGNLRSVAPVPLLIESLKDPHFAVRREVCTALGKIMDPRSVNALVPYLYDPEEEVRNAAKKALKQLGDNLDDKFKAEKKIAYGALMEASDRHWQSKGNSQKSSTARPKTAPPYNPFDFWGRQG